MQWLPRSLASLLTCVLALCWVSAASALPMSAPVAGGTSAGNIPLDSAGHWVLQRWVARHTGTLTALHLRIQADGSACRQDGHTGYGLGDGGTWHVTTHPVLADGRPDMGTTLATTDFRPCAAPASVVDIVRAVVSLPMNIPVRAGSEYATVIQNTDPSPAANFTSTNWLYNSSGLVGANGRNERSASAPDSYYGLDPRELVGYSSDGGATWSLPGGPYGHPDGRNFLPTYIQQYSDGTVAGQPYYYATDAVSTDQTMVFDHVPARWTISSLGAFSLAGGSGSLTLTVNGSVRAQAAVSGSGMLRAAITPVTVNPGQTVRVTTHNLSIADVVADDAWAGLLGLDLASAPWHVAAEPATSHAAPIYALPMYTACAVSSPKAVSARAAASRRIAQAAATRRRHHPPARKPSRHRRVKAHHPAPASAAALHSSC